MDWSCNRWTNNEIHVGQVTTTITTMPQFFNIWGWVDYMDEENNYSFRFRSSLVGFVVWSFVCCWFSWKLPGHFRSNDLSIWLVSDVLWYPALASLNVAAVALASLLDLCRREWGIIPSDLNMGLLIGKAIIVIILWDWYCLTVPLSLLWAFWWPPSACEL